MEYPDFLSKNGKIGVCAPSFGSTGDYEIRVKNAERKYNKLGHEIIYSRHCFDLYKAESCDAVTRAKEFEEIYFDNEIECVFSIAGGEFEIEILPYIDFDKLKKTKPKYFLGYSDNTVITFLLTTACDIASIYSPCFSSYGMNRWHKSLLDCYNFLTGKRCESPLCNYKYCEKKVDLKNENNPLRGYNLRCKTNWKILSGQNSVNFGGRLIGGCLDVLVKLCGTKFDNVNQFIEKYKDDGIVWYFESCDLNVLEQARCIWQLKQNGWFEHVKGFLIGRPKNKTTSFDIDYCEANFRHLKQFDVPVIIDCDFGHVAPSFYMINGALVNVTADDKKAEINYLLK